MLQKTVDRLLRSRHPWRMIEFDELSELYVSMLFRGLAISMTGLFVPIYMLRLGYDISSIMMVVAWYFTARFVFTDFFSALTVARIGPKHTMLIGYILLSCNTAMFLTISAFNWPIWLIGSFWGASASYFFIPFHVDFSKVKHSKNGGKEIGYLQIMEKSGAALGPLVGGIIATLFGGQYLFLIATILIIVGLIPLFLTREPTKTRQHIRLAGLPIRKLKRDYISVGAFGVENTLSIFLWPTFIGLFILIDNTVYAKIGLLTTIAIISSILAAYAIGKIIDNKKGRALLRANAVANSGLQLARPFISTYPGAFLVSVANDIVTSGYRMPYQKGWYDAADDLPGYRIVYIASMEWFSSLCKSSIWWFLVLLTGFFTDRTVLNVGFILAAIASMLIMTEKFKALNVKKP